MPRPKLTGKPLADVEATLRWLDERGERPGATDDPLAVAAEVGLRVALHARTGKPEHLDRAQELARDLEAPDAATPWAAWSLWQLARHAGGNTTAARLQAERSGERALSSGRQLDPFLAHAVGRRVAGDAMGSVGTELANRIDMLYPELSLERDADLGQMLWALHLVLDEPWARLQRDRCLRNLDTLWVDPPGFFCHLPDYQAVKYADANYLVSVGLQSIGEWPERVWLLQEFFRYFRGGDDPDGAVRDHLLGCCALLPDGLLLRRD